MKKRLSALLAVLILLSPALPAAGLNNLDYAYLELEGPWLTVGQQARVKLVIPWTQMGINVEFQNFYTPDREVSNQLTGIDNQGPSRDGVYTFVPDRPGQYMITATLSKEGRQPLTIKSNLLYAYPPGDENKADTVPGKVKALVKAAKAQTGQDAYALALALHDQLIYNADYDQTYAIHGPEGVLLQGSGVCESYATAYQMLLSEAGIPNVYVTGESKGQPHAWNLIKLNGEWTYVDATWNDPLSNQPNAEWHAYFGLTSQEMQRDHDWRAGDNIPPEATSKRYNAVLNKGALPYTSLDDLHSLLLKALEQGSTQIDLVFQGDHLPFDAADAAYTWLMDNLGDFHGESLNISSSEYTMSITLTYYPK